MVRREEVFTFIENNYNVSPSFLWPNKFPNYAVFRHESQGKWFGILMNVTGDKIGLESQDEVDILVVKVPAELLGSFIDNQRVFRAYHMNKNHWLSLLISEFEKLQEMEAYLAMSYDLTL